MKTKAVKRAEAVNRMKSYKWENSKAKRTGKLTREEWANQLQASIEKLQSK